MGLLESLPLIGDVFKGTTDIVKEVVVDKDMQNKLLGALEEGKQSIEKELYLQELQTQTIPWVDGLHKMARTILNVVTIVAVVVLSLFGQEITPTMALVLGGGNVAYQIIKGKGK